jgi:hypothetical protein
MTRPGLTNGGQIMSKKTRVLSDKEWASMHVLRQVYDEFIKYVDIEDLKYGVERIEELRYEGYFSSYPATYSNRMKVLRDLLKERGCDIPKRIGPYKFIEKEETDE